MYAHCKEIKGYLDNGLENWFYHLKITDNGWEISVEFEDDEWLHQEASGETLSPNEMIEKATRLFATFIEKNKKATEAGRKAFNRRYVSLDDQN